MKANGSDLAGKRVLFIAPMFFGYEKIIVSELEAKGAKVDYFNDRPDNSFWTKALIRLDRRLLAKKTDLYYSNIVQAVSQKDYDHILIVRGEAISASVLRKLRVSQTRAKMSLYLWDSMHYNPNAKKILEYFDRILSFDRSDAERFPRIEFLPLFYGNEFERAAAWNAAPLYDACFIGTVHTDRYKVLEKIFVDLKSKGLKVFVFCYYPSKILYRLRTLIDPGFRKFGREYVSFNGMKLTDVVDRIAESRSVIDVNRPGQLGLTMRTIEAVGAQRRLITTNSDIVNYDVFNDKGVLLVDRDSPNVPSDFLIFEGKPFDAALRKKYSVSAWVDEIFK